MPLSNYTSPKIEYEDIENLEEHNPLNDGVPVEQGESQPWCDDIKEIILDENEKDEISQAPESWEDTLEFISDQEEALAKVDISIIRIHELQELIRDLENSKGTWLAELKDFSLVSPRDSEKIIAHVKKIQIEINEASEEIEKLKQLETEKFELFTNLRLEYAEISHPNSLSGLPATEADSSFELVG